MMHMADKTPIQEEKDLSTPHTSKLKLWLKDLGDKVYYTSFAERFFWLLWLLVIIQLVYVLKEGTWNVGPLKVILNIFNAMAKLDGPRALPSDFGGSELSP